MWLVFICIPVVPHEISNPTRRRVATQGHITTPDQSSPPHSAPHLARQPEQHHVAPTPLGHPTPLARALLDSSPHQGGDHFLPTPVLLTIEATCTATIGAGPHRLRQSRLRGFRRSLHGHHRPPASMRPIPVRMQQQPPVHAMQSTAALGSGSGCHVAHL